MDNRNEMGRRVAIQVRGCSTQDRNAKAVSSATSSGNTQGKGSVFSHDGSGNTRQRAVSVATKAAGTHKAKGSVFSHEGSGSTRQKQSLTTFCCCCVQVFDRLFGQTADKEAWRTNTETSDGIHGPAFQAASFVDGALRLQFANALGLHWRPTYQCEQ